MKQQVIGPVTIDAIIEIDRLVVEPSFLLAGATPEAVAEHRSWLGPGFIEPATNRLVYSVQSFLVRTKHRTILIDTCCGNGRDRGPASPYSNLDTDYLGRLGALGVSPGDIDLVLCTHCHADHVGWNMRDDDGRWVPTFPNARYLIGKAEYAFWERALAEGLGSIGSRNAFRDSVLPIVAAGQADLIDDAGGFDLNDGLVRLLPLPGHTPGHFGVEIAHRSERLVLIGDAIHHPIQFARPDWANPADVLPEESARTRKKIVENCIDTPTLIVPTHFSSPTAGRIVSVRGKPRFEFGE